MTTHRKDPKGLAAVTLVFAFSGIALAAPGGADPVSPTPPTNQPVYTVPPGWEPKNPVPPPSPTPPTSLARALRRERHP